MLYLVINQTRSGLSDQEMATLAERAKAFYGNVPSGLIVKENWTEHNGARTVALLETDDELLLKQVQAPFLGLVDMEVIALEPIAGWRDSTS